jgi:hypothetical protein
MNINTKDTINSNPTEDFIYLNSFGNLFRERLVSQLFNKKTPMQMQQIHKIVIVKRRVFTLNYIFFTTSLLSLLLCYFFITHLNFKVMIVILFLATLQFLASMIITTNKYKVVVVRKEKKPIKIEFPNYFTTDALVIMQKVNKYLKQLEKKVIAFDIKKSV